MSDSDQGRDYGAGRHRSRGRGNRGASERGGRRTEADRGTGDPELDPRIEPADLDRAARARLRTLSKENADRVAVHLVMAGRLVDAEPDAAYAHAHAALRRASRVDIVREAVALTAYAVGNYAEALRELRTARRLSGLDLHRAVEADCERGLGRPERALAVAASAPTTGMDLADRVELAIVVSGARLDLDEPEAALLALDIDGTRTGSEEQHRLAQQRITVLRALGREQEARELSARWPEPNPDDEVTFFEIVPEPDEEPRR